MIFTFEALTEMQTRLAQEGVSFHWVLDDRAIVRDETYRALTDMARKAGYGGLWAGFSAEAQFVGGQLLCRSRALHCEEQPLGKLYVDFNHTHGAQIPQLVVEAAHGAGLSASWTGNPAESVTLTPGRPA